MSKSQHSQLRDDLHRDGVIHIPSFLSPTDLIDVADAFEWTENNRGPGYTPFPGDPGAWQDLANPAAYQAYLGMLQRSPISGLLSALWGGGPVWFMYEQIFNKEGTSNRTPWHQDTPYMPINGEHMAVVWISLDPVSREETLEFCRGSHRGTLFNATSFKPDDPTDPLYKDADLPRLPDIESERDQWDIVGWATEPGDVVIFHPSTLHGGGAPGATGRRRTLTLRYFGENAYYEARPGPTPAPRVEGLNESLTEGAPFRHPVFPRLA